MASLNTRTAQKIHEAYQDNTIFSAIVFGKRGIGKSSFCLKVIYDIYHNALNFEVRKAWIQTLVQTLSSKEQVSDRADELREEEKTARVLQWDDVEQWMSSDIWQKKNNQEERELLFEVRRLMPTMRTRSASNLYSCDNPLGLDPSIKKRPHHIIKIVKGGNSDHAIPRTARVYSQDVYPSFQKRINPDTLWTHEFDAKLPNWLFNIYDDMRTEYSDRQIRKAKKTREKQRKENAIEKYKITPEQAAYLYLRNQPDVSYRQIMNYTGVNKQTILRKTKELKKKDLDFDI